MVRSTRTALRPPTAPALRATATLNPNPTAQANFKLCRELAWPHPVPDAPSYRNMVFDGLHGDAWRAAWLHCLPEAPCHNVTFTNVDVAVTTPEWVCENIYGKGPPSSAGCFEGAQ
jgi:hypothetical protein